MNYIANLNATELVTSSRSDAADVIRAVEELIAKYGHASVSDLYDLVGLPPTFIDTQYGWTSAEGFKMLEVPDGFRLVFPMPEQI